MRTGMFGGTFDPIHNGHIRLAKYFIEILDLDRLILMPAGIPPHKQAHAVSGEHRFNMCSLAAQCDERIKVSDIELRREGKSYTCDTLLRLHELFPGDEFFLLVGADMFLTYETWYNFDLLKTLASVCAISRGQAGFEELCAYAERLRTMGCRCIVEDLPPMDISSTEIRESVKNGGDISGLVPPAVEEYIRSNGLYK